MATREVRGLGGRAIAGAVVYNEDLRKGKVRLIQVLDNPVEGGG